MPGAANLLASPNSSLVAGSPTGSFLSHGPDAAARDPHSFYGIEFSASSDSGPYQTNEVASPAEGLGVLAVHRARAELWKTWTFGENA